MCKGLARIAVTLTLIAVAANTYSIPITGEFGGKLTHDCGDFVPGTGCIGFGFGFDVGDPFSGYFAYDSLTGDPLYLNAVVAGTELVATNLQTTIQLFDGHITFFSMVGEIEANLYMGIGLTNGSPVFLDNPPQALNSDDWLLAAFNISRSNVPPIEQHTNQTEAIRSVVFRPSSPSMFIHAPVQVSEPGSLLLVLYGLVLLVVNARKRR